VLGSPAEFQGAVRQWVPAIRAAGAAPVLFMTWARHVEASEAATMQDGLARAYQDIGKELAVSVSPVGLAWAESLKRLPTVTLHAADRSHPTPAGSYLSALVLYITLTGRNPTGATAVINGRPTQQMEGSPQYVADSTRNVRLVELSAATATALQNVAWSVAQPR